ncbi:hypothetical protein B0H65DRAFT_154416 [Neurospora tetraspora]|uniref:Uncharacterized protein n=1 Tax=Neurospora tetraspora TaxID=94610 RepID=A0AAE0JHG5_9PEZI|nr:hypothetical protein B0H65DRAFT_154416 [Neurospora tetraspora]
MSAGHERISTWLQLRPICSRRQVLPTRQTAAVTDVVRARIRGSFHLHICTYIGTYIGRVPPRFVPFRLILPFCPCRSYQHTPNIDFSSSGQHPWNSNSPSFTRPQASDECRRRTRDTIEASSMAQTSMIATTSKVGTLRALQGKKHRQSPMVASTEPPFSSRLGGGPTGAHRPTLWPKTSQPHARYAPEAFAVVRPSSPLHS